jgi:glycoside/pentoside/hexuronide:cation symporter, GPH family
VTNADSIPEEDRPRETAAADKVSLREKIGLGFGKGVVDGAHGTLHVLITPIYVNTMAMDPRLASTIVFIQRIWDALTDPVVGQYSDNVRTRWGRRIPLMFVAALPLALFFGAMWWFPAGADQQFLFVFLLVTSLLFYTAHTVFAMPLNSLIIEATDDYHERSRIAGVTIAFGFAVQLGAQWLVPLMQLKFWGGMINAVHWVATGCAAIFVVMGLVPIFLCKERLYKKVAVRQKRMSFLQGLRAVKDSPSFMRMLLARGLFSLCYNLVGALSFYLYVYLVFGGVRKEAFIYYGFIGSSYHIAALVTSVLVYPWLERRLGKKRTFQAAAVAMLVGCAGKIFLFQPGWIWTPILVTAFNGIANAGISLMAVAMLADIADEDELRTGLRREGLFSSLLTWVDKAGNSLGSWITGFVVIWVGFQTPPKDFSLEEAFTQTDTTLWWLKFTYVIVPAIGSLATIWFIRRYALTRERMYKIKDELARRREQAAAEPDAESPVA